MNTFLWLLGYTALAGSLLVWWNRVVLMEQIAKRSAYIHSGFDLDAEGADRDGKMADMLRKMTEKPLVEMEPEQIEARAERRMREALVALVADLQTAVDNGDISGIAGQSAIEMVQEKIEQFVEMVRVQANMATLAGDTQRPLNIEKKNRLPPNKFVLAQLDTFINEKAESLRVETAEMLGMEYNPEA